MGYSLTGGGFKDTIPGFERLCWRRAFLNASSGRGDLSLRVRWDGCDGMGGVRFGRLIFELWDGRNGFFVFVICWKMGGAVGENVGRRIFYYFSLKARVELWLLSGCFAASERAREQSKYSLRDYSFG